MLSIFIGSFLASGISGDSSSLLSVYSTISSQSGLSSTGYSFLVRLKGVNMLNENIIDPSKSTWQPCNI